MKREHSKAYKKAIKTAKKAGYKTKNVDYVIKVSQTWFQVFA